MFRKTLLPAVLLLLSLSSRISAHAAGTFISAPSRVDMVHDASRDTLYISSAGQVLRYRLGSATFDAPFVLGGSLKGMDLSPDGNTLAVADQTRTATEVWVWLIDLPTGTAQKVTFPRAFGEGGTFSPAFANDGALLISGTYEGSGWVPLRRYNPATGNTTILPVPPFNDVRQSSMLAASGDASMVGWEESNISDGAFGRYRVSDGNVLKKSGSGGTGWFNYEIGVNANGTQYALPTFGGCFITDGNLVKQRTLGTSGGGSQPIGVVFHPVEPLVYFAWSTTTQVRAFETAGYTQVASYDAGYTFTHPGNAAFQWGRLKMSRDGSLLFGTVGNGVRYFNLYAPLAATSPSVSTAEDTALPVTLSGSVGNGGAISYEIGEQPQHGILTGDAPNLLYTPDPDYSGPDSFTFVATYGRARATGTVTIDVTPVNDPPIADFQSIGTDEDTAVSIHLTGTDADGDPLTFAVTATPTHGTLSGTAPDLVYTPDPDYFGDDSLSFTVNDGQATSAPRTISISVVSVNDAPVANSGSLATDEDTAGSVVLSGADLEGSTLSFAIAAAPAHGTLSGTAPNLVYTPAANYNGADSFTFTVSDGEATSAPARVSISVASVNDPPVANAGSLSTDEDTAGSIVLSGSDVEGSALSFAIVAAPAHGTLSGTAPNLVYTPATNFTGADSFTFTVSDGEATSAPATVSISVASVNDPPVANAGSLSTNEDTAGSIVLPGSDVEGSALSFAIATSPAHGTLSGTAPNLVYTPAANYFGADSFTFTVNDGEATSAPATVSISVASVNDPPVANAGSLSTNEDTASGIVLTGSDIEGSALTYTIVVAPAHGTLSGSGANRVYTPAANYNGADSFTFRVNDGQASSAPATVSISIASVNDPPIAVANTGTTTKNTAVVLAVVANDSDVDGDALTITAAGPATPSGTVTLLAGATTVRYTPATGFTGTASFPYTISDGHGGSAIATVTVTVTKR
ncbi:MAG TPA: Ig-like domain-containing protein [Thermoanaerobaculia bacterium]|nr:Ig-like domain-containing protein [Thermoanaerobaculia bacterium]